MEGHTDERGTREYNLALGENRALSVKRQLSIMGVRDAQMDLVSFGEERPEMLGQGEEVFSLNRRVGVSLLMYSSFFTTSKLWISLSLVFYSFAVESQDSSISERLDRLERTRALRVCSIW